MIGKVVAKNPEFELILEFDETDGQWKCSIPSSAIGEYYVDIYAWDFAGNLAYMSKALFVVDTSGIHMMPLVSNFYCRIKDSFHVQMYENTRFNLSVKDVYRCNVTLIN